MNQTKKCRACNKVKPIGQYHSSGGQTKDGKKPRCKECILNGIRIPKSNFGKSKKPKDNSVFGDDYDYKIVAPKKTDYMMMYKLIELMGYNPDNAHEEFCKKWNLNPKFKKVRNQPVYLSNGEKNPLFVSTWFPKK